MVYLIGQRVILGGNEIGTLVPSENKDLPNTDREMWVFSPIKGYASRYALSNFQPLPYGQL